MLVRGRHVYCGEKFDLCTTMEEAVRALYLGCRGLTDEILSLLMAIEPARFKHIDLSPLLGYLGAGGSSLLTDSGRIHETGR